MDELIDNFINGNISDAKKQAENFENYQIREAFFAEFLYTGEGNDYNLLKKCCLIADYLKGRDCWQLLCDTK